MSQISSGIVCGGNNGATKYMVPLPPLLPPSSFSSSSSPSGSLSFSSFIKGKGLVLDYWGAASSNYNNNHKSGFKRRRGRVIEASSDVASPSIWDDWKPSKPKATSTPSFSDILWPSAGSIGFVSHPFLFLILFYQTSRVIIIPMEPICCTIFLIIVIRFRTNKKKTL